MRFEPWDLVPVRDAYKGLSVGQRGYMTRIANQDVGGYVIVRHAPEGLGLGHVYAELRPDKPVVTGPPTRHFHGDDGIEPNVPVAERHRHPAALMRSHIARAKQPDDHHGVNSNEVHEHVPKAKYVFPPSGKRERRWHHDHESYGDDSLKLKAHIERYHAGVNAPGRHLHTRLVKDPTASLAKRLDMHPLARPLFAAAERVFFVIEGCFKADAVLSAGEAVFSVPSVTLWDADELPAFIDAYLTGKRVVIVPDADWIKNPAVISQARLCQSFLERHGVTAHVAAPPQEAHHKGIDDFLGDGGMLDDLTVIGRRPASDWDAWWSCQKGRKDKIWRAMEGQWALALHAAPNGTITIPLRSLARVMNVDSRRVSRQISDLRDVYGAITVDGDLRWRRNWFSKEFEWRDPPVITLIPELRSEEPQYPLREVPH